jgi:PAS domain S-box-containing protein
VAHSNSVQHILSSSFQVLVIDGDPASRERLESLLERAGRMILSVTSIEEARDALRAIQFPLLIVDREIDGEQALQFCKQQRDEAGAAILLLTRVEQPSDVFAALASGANEYLSKHCDDSELLEAVDALLTGHGARTRGPSQGAAPMPINESERIKALREIGILDSMNDQGYDDITLLASHLFDVPMAAISLVDAERQWFKSRVGLPQAETAREVSFCAHAIAQPDEVLVVQNAVADARFVNNPLVAGDDGIRFYAGAPLVTPEGQALGTICVIDRKPRTLAPGERDLLWALARQTMLLLQHGRTKTALDQAMNSLRTTAAELRRSEALFREAYENAPIGIALVSTDGKWLRVNRSICEMLGYEPAELLATTFQAITHPEDLSTDLEFVQQVIQGTIRTYQMKKRYVHKLGHWVWALLSVSLVRNERGEPVYFVSQIQRLDASGG